MTRAASDLDHRPWSLPDRPWTMRHTWHDLLFMHWPVPAQPLRAMLPPGVELDTFERQAWLGVIPFWMSGIRLRRWPAVPMLAGFPEINVRTYVRCHGRAGVWFVSLDGQHRLLTRIARAWYRLPYHPARVRVRRRDGEVVFASCRTSRHSPPAEFEASYGPVANVRRASPGSLAHWLTERYALFTSDGRGQVWTAEIHHAPWPLQVAEADCTINTMTSAALLERPAARPILHFSKRLDVLVWSPRVATAHEPIPTSDLAVASETSPQDRPYARLA